MVFICFWTYFLRFKGAWFSCDSCSHFNAQCHERTAQWKYKKPSLLHMYGLWAAETTFCRFVKFKIQLGLHQIYPSTIVRKEKYMLNETVFKKLHFSTLTSYFFSVSYFLAAVYSNWAMVCLIPTKYQKWCHSLTLTKMLALIWASGLNCVHVTSVDWSGIVLLDLKKN